MEFVMPLGLAAACIGGIVWAGMVVFLRMKRQKSAAYLLFFTIFYIYLLAVLNYTLFQFQSLILLKHFAPDLILNGIAHAKAVNLVPLVTLTRKALKTSLLNILLMVPFGFGLPFITDLRMKGVVVAGVLLSVSIECLQFLTGFLAHITFRVADMNDVLFNAVGVVAGYLLFIGFVRLYRHASRDWSAGAHPILRHIAERPQAE